MKPVIELRLSTPPTENGFSINVTCTAESYPPANQDDFSIQHPLGETIDSVPFIHSTGTYGVYHQRESAVCDDFGVYACHVQVGNTVTNDVSSRFTVPGKLYQC